MFTSLSKTLVLSALALFLSACGMFQPEPDFYVDGVGVKIETSQAWAHADDFPDHFRNIVNPSLAHWGGTWKDLHGWVIVIKDGDVQCDGGHDNNGCTEDWRQTVTVNTNPFCSGPNCTVSSSVELTVLAHEIGHVVIGDHCHDDGRWREWEDVVSTLPWDLQWWWLPSAWAANAHTC